VPVRLTRGSQGLLLLEQFALRRIHTIGRAMVVHDSYISFSDVSNARKYPRMEKSRKGPVLSCVTLLMASIGAFDVLGGEAFRVGPGMLEEIQIAPAHN
jgi:hypothetical protein